MSMHGMTGGMRCWARALRPMAFVAALAVLVLVAPVARAVEVALLLSENSGPEQQFADAFRAALKPGAHRVVHAGAVREGMKVDALSSAGLVLTTGALAAEIALRDTDRPVLMVLVGIREVQRLQAAYPARSVGAVVLDQPPERHMRLIRAILPEEARIGVLMGPESRFQEQEILRAAEGTGFVVELADVADPKELVGALQAVLDKAGALLPLPDGLVSSPGAARTILLTSYRYRRPIFAFSSAYVSAGALAAVFSSAEHIASDIADLLGSESVRAGDVAPLLSVLRFPERFDVAVNRTVARALGIVVPEEDVLRERVAGGEGTR